MGQCVARDLGFDVDRQTKNATLIKKMEERLNRKRTTYKDRSKEDLTYSDVYDRTLQQNKGDYTSDVDDPLDFKTSMLSKNTKTSRKSSNFDNQYQDRDTLALSFTQSPILNDPDQKNRDLLLALADSNSTSRTNRDFLPSAGLAERRVAPKRKDFYLLEKNTGKESREHAEKFDDIQNPMTCRLSHSSKEEDKVGEEDEKSPEETKTRSPSRQFTFNVTPNEKRETWDTGTSSAAQRLNRFRENRPFEFNKIKKGGFIEDKAMNGKNKSKSPNERTKSPNERNKSLSKAELFEGIDKVDFRPQIRNYTEKSLVYQSSLSTGPRIIGFENEFFKHQVTKHANLQTPRIDEKFVAVFPDGFDTENTDLE